MQNQIVEGYELSPQQKELWQMMQQAPGAEFGLQCEVRIEGAVERRRLERAVDEVLGRHEILRTRYEQLAGLRYPLQVINEAGESSVSVRWNEDSEAVVLELALEAMSGDHQSLNNLVQEIAAAYLAPAQRVSYLHYADASEIFNELAGAEETRGGREHWERVKASAVEEPQLVFAKTDSGGFAPEQVEFTFAPLTEQKLAEFCRRREVAEKEVLLTAWTALLARLSSQSRLRLDLTSNGRRHEEIVSAVGLFARRLPLVLSVEKNFELTLAAVTEEMGLAEKWQEYYQAETGESGGYGFEFYEWPRAIALGGVRFVMVRRQVRQQREQMRLTVGWSDEGARLALEYDGSVFAASDAERMCEEYETLLNAALAESSMPLTELEIVGAREREQLLQVMSGRRRARNTEPVHEAVLRQVQARPGVVAVAGANEQLTYAELNRRANQVAWYLISRGVGPEQVVAISMERSVELVVGLLGILKAGGAYLPLDPAYPAARLQQMISDSRASLVLSRSQHRQVLKESAAPIFYLDEGQEEIAQQSEAEVGRRAEAENLAYVLYTSGSTGQPKGVMIEHRALSNHMAWIIHAAELNEHDVVLQKTGISFDASVWEFWGALQVGGRLAVGGTGVMDGEEILSLASKHEATILQVVPTQLRLLVETERLSECDSLRRVMTGGEVLRAELVARYYKQQKALLINLYGPTETTIDATWKPLQRGERVTLGRAIDNVEVLVLGAQQRLKASGEVGEIYIGGAGLGRCYLGQPGQTAEKFVPDGMSGAGGGRLYRTGDLGRVVNGELEYVGRVDEQVKVRGYRIELGEIEAELNGQAEVKASAVVENEGRLVAYVELRAGVAAAELQQRLRKRLPEWMVPGVYERVAQLPVNRNGKVDRKRLREAAVERLAVGSEYEAARSGVEEVLAGIWSEVLQVERVGIHDNFFELGGDSILSIKVIARANRAGFKLTARQLFQNQTIAELASVASKATTPTSPQGTIIGKVPLTAIQRRFFLENVTDGHHYNQSVLFETHDRLDETLLRQVFSALVAHHDALRLRFEKTPTGWEQINAAAEEDCLTRIDLSDVAERDRTTLLERATSDLQASLDLTNGPIIRGVWFTLPTAIGDRLMIAIHHLATDGVSWRILLDDLQRAYVQLKNGESIDLGFKTTSFQQWAERLVEYTQSPELISELPFWLDMLDTVHESIPVDNPDGTNDRRSAKRFSLSLNEQDTVALLQLAQKKYRAQINDLLMTALMEAFHRWAGMTSLSVNLEGHGREDLFDDLDLTRTLGWFTTIFPVRLRKKEGDGLVTTLRRVKDVLRSLPNKGFGYGLLRYVAQGNSLLEQLRERREPLVSLNYLGQLDQTVPEALGFSAAQESMGAMQSTRGTRTNLLDFSAGVIGGRLWVGCTYSENIYAGETIESLTRAFLDALKSLVMLCEDSYAKAYTPTDFPLARLDERKLARLTTAYPDIEDIYPLSHMQQGMLFHNLYAPKSTTYFLQLGCTLHGSLDLEAFSDAWRGVIAKHPILRTAFVWEGMEEPLQVVCANAELLLEQHDWRTLSPAEQEEKFEALLKEDRDKGFDLSKAPLMRFSLIAKGDDCHYFVWSRHHLLMDGWSLPLILKEVFALYGAYVKGVDVEIEPARSFGDYIVWLKQQDLGEAERFWREQLQGFTTPTPIGNQISRSSSNNGEESFAEVRRQLSAEMTQELHSFVRRHQLTLNTSLLGAWGILLSRYSDSRDVVFGTAVSGRPPSLASVESIVGVFINMLPLRASLSGDERLSEWLQQLQQRQMEMQQYEFTPLVHIQNWSDVQRGLPLFESVLIFENYPMDDVIGSREGTLTISNLRSVDRNNYPLNWLIMPGPELLLRAIYNCAQFDQIFIAKLVEQFETVLSLLVKSSTLTVTDFSILVNDTFKQQEVAIEKMLEEAGKTKLKNITRRVVSAG